MSIYLSADISCLISSIGKTAASASGLIGLRVAGSSGGEGLFGMSATMLYHWRGISLSLKRIFVFFFISSCIK